MLNMEKYFSGYDVPEKIKQTVTAICNRFAINGLCDPMYISNTIACLNGFGNGCGSFSEPAEIDANKTAIDLQRCYGCNILKTEIDELADIILRNGDVNVQTLFSGLSNFKKRNIEEAKERGGWRAEYLERENAYIEKILSSFETEV